MKKKRSRYNLSSPRNKRPGNNDEDSVTFSSTNVQSPATFHDDSIIYEGDESKFHNQSQDDDDDEYGDETFHGLEESEIDTRSRKGSAFSQTAEFADENASDDDEEEDDDERRQEKKVAFGITDAITDAIDGEQAL